MARLGRELHVVVMDLYRHGIIKFPNAGLLASSHERGWTGVAAELRSHPPGDLPAIVPTQMEITLATRRSPGAWVSRKGAGVRQQTAVEAGTIWLCPVGVGEDDINISAPLTEILHIYLPVDRFKALAELYGDPRIRADTVRYLADVQDPLVRQIAVSILGELVDESSAGRMMVETAALTLTARIAQAYGHDRPDAAAPSSEEGTCPDRIQRAIAFIHDNLEHDLSIAELAAVACLSPFHFARMFKRVTGQTPYGYVSAERLACACRLLSDRKTPILDIALRCGFSSQAAFGTAFKRAKGSTPSEYRRLSS
ncbi:AraC family transcriptional regulator [Methylobacterium sp. Leaf118]|uniref:AraC family transcriptional regulator n=1 Tax=Methylobacterium sp. Leaf118 TaxID=2876562 RepID=UPI001E2D54B5|nr:AraC family transcriptional regulator [Methylobacterium sp. Leaf118]